MLSVMQNVLYYFASAVLARVSGVIKSFWLAKILEPSDFGIWTGLLLISAYVPIASLGVTEAMVKKVPFFAGGNDQESVKSIEGGVLSYQIILAALFTAVAFVFVLIPRPAARQGLNAQVALVLVTCSLSSISSVFYFRFVSFQNFGVTSRIVTLRSILVLAFQIVFAYLYGLTGAVLGVALCELLVLAYSARASRRTLGTIRPRFSFSLFASLIRIGFPITLVSWTYTIQTSVDRVVSLSLLGETATGYYGIGVAIAGSLLLLPDAINQVLYPKLNETYGRTRKYADLVPLVIEPSRVMALLVAFLTSISFFLLPVIFHSLLPKYLPGLVSAQLLIVGTLFGGVTRNGANFLIAVDRQRVLLVSLLVSVLLNLVGCVFLAKVGLGVQGIAASTLISTILFAVLVWFSAFKSMGFDRAAQSRLFLEIHLPAILFATTAFPAHCIQDALGGSILSRSALAFSIQFVANWGILACIPAYRKSIGRSFILAGKAFRGLLFRNTLAGSG